MACKPLEQGGCWYCKQDTEPMSFTCEFDANIHIACLLKALEKDPEDWEAQIIAREFEISIPTSLNMENGL